MTKFRYRLEPYKGMNTRYICPSCKKKDKTFSRYIDIEKDNHIHPSVGKCNRDNKCGYHYTPKEYFKDNKISFDAFKLKKQHTKLSDANFQLKPVSFIPVDIFKESLQNHESNNFVKFLITLFGIEISRQVISRYFIGTSNHWMGATVFWQIDISGKVRTGKIMLYDPTTGKRIKEPFNHITWVHNVLRPPDFELKQCLFGEHLLRTDPLKPIAIVESEKTAIIASVYLPEFLWLATGSLANLSVEKCQVLKGRNVILFPDLNGFDKWEKKSIGLLAKVSISKLLEKKANKAEKQQGLDLADYLIRFDYKEFI